MTGYFWGFHGQNASWLFGFVDFESSWKARALGLSVGVVLQWRPSKVARLHLRAQPGEWAWMNTNNWAGCCRRPEMNEGWEKSWFSPTLRRRRWSSFNVISSRLWCRSPRQRQELDLRWHQPLRPQSRQWQRLALWRMRQRGDCRMIRSGMMQKWWWMPRMLPGFWLSNRCWHTQVRLKWPPLWKVVDMNQLCPFHMWIPRGSRLWTMMTWTIGTSCHPPVRTLQGGVPPSVFCPSGSPWSGHMNIWCALPCLEAGRWPPTWSGSRPHTPKPTWSVGQGRQESTWLDSWGGWNSWMTRTCSLWKVFAGSLPIDDWWEWMASLWIFFSWLAMQSVLEDFC